MKLLTDYLDDAKAKSGSDYATAKRLGVTKQAISAARISRGMNVENCTKLAMFLGVDPMAVIAAGEIEKHPEKAQFWGRWVAASVALVTILSVGVLSQGADIYTNPEILSLPVIYIMRNCQ